MAFTESVILPSTMSPPTTTRAHHRRTPESVMPPPATSLTTTTRACHLWAPSSQSCHKRPCLRLRLVEHTVDGLSWVGHTSTGNVLDYDCLDKLPSFLTWIITRYARRVLRIRRRQWIQVYPSNDSPILICTMTLGRQFGWVKMMLYSKEPYLTHFCKSSSWGYID